MRISQPMDWCDLERVTTDAHMKLTYRRARCQHGKTRTQTCIECEYGYADDSHTFANINSEVAHLNGRPLIAVSDDGEDVAYVDARRPYLFIGKV